MDSKQVRSIMEAYVSVYQEKKEVEQLDENVQDAVKGALEAGADFMEKNPVGKAIGGIIGRVGKGRKTPTATSGGYRPEEVETDLYNIILEYLVAEGYADTNEAALVIMGNMSEEWRRSIVEGFPNVQNKPRPGDAGTSGLKMIQTPGGQRGYINKHSGGEILPSGTVDKIMGGNLMVKNGTKKNTNSNIA
jgi:hypothetical protein